MYPQPRECPVHTIEVWRQYGAMEPEFIASVRSRLAVVVLLCVDAAAVLLAVTISLSLRFDGSPWHWVYEHHLAGHLLSLPFSLAVYLAAFRAFRLYRYAWRFAGLETLQAVVYSNTVGLVGLILTQLVVDGATFPRSVLIILWATGIILTGSFRVLLRVLSIARQHARHSSFAAGRGSHRKRAVILGGGDTGARTLRAVSDDPTLHYHIIGILDDDPSKQGMYIGSVKVLGRLDSLKQLVATAAVDEVIIALPEGCGRKIREYVLECRGRKVPVKVVPQIRQVLNDGGSSVQLVDFSVEDLLRRPPAHKSASDNGSYVTGKRVMVTGAGGSIGSELCRQVVSLKPASLVLLGHGENSIHRIYCELQREYPSLSDRMHCVIASVADECRMNQVFARFRPQVVFHAAAHKHVPMMEANEQEGVHNNIIGTYRVADTCGKFGVERVVLLSTDKAADPCSVMGATKWVCEEVVRAVASLWPVTSYITVRFGNVLGSRGSVVPVFKEQIMHGGPVTVTHPDMTRYFMTIPEAVSLVLQAGAVGASRELYLLDMGEPVKIVDLAKDMIRLCGFEPGVEIEIAYTGVRPGERLHERLASEVERIEPTPWPGLSIIRRPDHYLPAEMLGSLKRLEQAANHGSASDVRSLLYEIVHSGGVDESLTPVESGGDVEATYL